MMGFLSFKRRLRSALWPALGIGLVAYFGYHTVQGDHGLLARNVLEVKLDEAEGKLAQLQSERRELENRVTLLQPDNLDLDMLDERVRAMLNYSHPNEVVIFRQPNNIEPPTADENK